MIQMAKKSSSYICVNCNAPSAKWAGQCSSCDQWNTIEENIPSDNPIDLNSIQALALSDLQICHTDRIVTNIQEFNHVCGGGIVPGAVMLIGGEPGIGKSTLLLQLCNSIPVGGSTAVGTPAVDKKPLYISGEEAAAQVALRAQRLGINTNNFLCAFGTNLAQIYALIEQTKPSLVIIDSIQTMHYDQCEAGVGTVGQIRACSQVLTQYAKTHNVPIIIVGHITKEGALAGPKVLEHMVDVVLYFEGERTYPCRILRAVKNRFGATDEVGIFEMESGGLKEIANPSQFFLQHMSSNSSGVIIFPSIEGSRPLLIELQALTLHSNMQMPRRAVVGWDHTRLSMIAAVLETKLKVQLSQKEIYVNIVGGLKIIEPGTDLAAALAIMSAYYNIPIPRDTIAFGEIGLSGEIRQVTRAAARIKEAHKLGIKRALAPANVSNTDSNKNTSTELEIIPCNDLQDVLMWLKKQAVKKNI